MAMITITNKMKALGLFLLLLSLSACTQQTNSKEAENNIIDSLNIDQKESKVIEDEGVQFLKLFYLSYFKINLDSSTDSKKGHELIHNSITKRLQKEMFNSGDEYDLDAGEGYFWIVQSQDFFDEWLETLHVFQDKRNLNIYYVNYSNPTSNGEFDICIKLALVKENGHYLIDQIFKDDSLDCKLIESEF